MARAAKFYAAGLESPLLQLRTGALLVRACKDQLRKGCEAEQADLAARNEVITLLDALTLFPQRSETDPTAQITRPKELRQKIRDTSAALMREAGRYDRQLFARYGATLKVCPDEDSTVFASAVEKLTLINLASFQALGTELDAARADIAGEEARAVEQLRTWSGEGCLAARKLGEYLMELMNSKLRPWNKPEAPAGGDREFNFDQPRKEAPPPTPDRAEAAANDRELALAVAGNFVSVVATELQLLVFPESASRI